MPDTDLTRLAERLDTPVDALAALRTLSSDDVRRLDEAVAAAITAEDKAFDEALQRTLKHVPRPLRGAARALLVPEADRD